jgi:predicted small metal-binding protein
MSKYYISCRDVGWKDCNFSTQADTIEQVIEQCADHGRIQHDLKGFGKELYARMRPHIHEAEDGQHLQRISR